MPSRRSFLKNAGFLGAASAMSASPLAAASDKDAVRRSRGAKNLIFLVSDGMGTGTLSLANHWSLHNRKRPLHWMNLYNRPGWRTCLQDTASASSPVTDSAAAGSAWGSGQRLNNRSINYSPDGEALEPVFVTAKKAGKATGVVSTCRITHATPAAFVANMHHRDDEDAIADQYLEREMDVYLGGGLRHFQSRERDLLKGFAKKGYDVCRNAQELMSVDEKRTRLLGLFSDSHIPYAIDRANDMSFSHVPRLEQMFEAALDVIGEREEGFVLQVEAGRVDHAGHANDPATILQEQLEFDRCIPIALNFMESHPDTLVIVTTDHGTGGCQLNGLGDGYNGSGAALGRINRFTSSFEAMAAIFRSKGRFDPAVFEDATGIAPTKAQAAAVQSAMEEGKKYLTSVLSDVFVAELLETTGVGWTSHNHTGEHVELLAAGPGADGIPALFDNYELHGQLLSALGIA